MTDFYSPDEFFWPFNISSSNNELHITEGLTSTSSDSFTATIPTSDSVDQTYYTYSHSDPITGRETIKNQNQEIRSFYGEVVKALRDNSPNNRDYRIQADTPSGSDMTLGGILIDHGSNSQWSIDFSPSDSVNPRLLGFGDISTSKTSDEAGILDAPFTRWGSWISPPDKKMDKRQEVSQTGGFTSSGHYPYRKTWRPSPSDKNSANWTNAPQRKREFRYKNVESAFLFIDDRVQRQSEADRCALKKDDINNQLEDLWKRGPSSDYIIVSPNAGDTDLDRDGYPRKRMLGVVDHESFGDMFSPQDGEEPYRGESYDVSVTLIQVQPDPYFPARADVYRH